ncbi:integrase catalytic domain-containing protein [Trichonephila clavipes]|nr:integrase catalytic domain-containing protein [Trichonephila clavipes]
MLVYVKLTQIRETYWILCGRQTVKSCLKKCLICRRFKVRPGNQITAPLPENRIQAEFPFETVGIDFAGPIYTKNDEKAYISLFTCAVTRAIHLEVVPSLSTGHFLLAFRRFIARRGICHTVNSDNAFKSADIELKRLYMNICEPDVQNYFGEKGEEKVPGQLWRLGKIIEIHKGRDGKVRSATIKTSTGIMKRPVQ